MCNIPECDQICGNCAHWDLDNETLVPVWNKPQATAPVHYLRLAPCKANAIEVDAGACVPMLGEYGNCLQHNQAFEPSEAYLAGLRESESIAAERVFAQPYEIPRRQQALQEAV